MATRRSRVSWNIVNLDSRVHTVILVSMVAILSYLAAKIAEVVILRPQMVWPLWPGCVLLVSVLLLLPRRIWPALIVAAFAAFVVYDLQAAVPVRSIVLLILADTVEVLTAALCLSYFFDGLPQLDSIKALAKFSFFAIFLAPFAAAFVGALALNGNYWTRWRIGFFSEAIGFLTLLPAVLSWASLARPWANRSRAYYVEAATLLAALVLFGYLTFVAPWSSRGSPALLYSLVPFLLWSALRFGSMGVSSSVLVIAFLSIGGAVHGRGPFSGPEPLSNVLSLQLFLLCTALPFMVLAALVEERKRIEEALRESEERFRLVANTAPALIWMSGTDKLCIFFNKGWLDFTGRSLDSELGKGWAEGVHPEDLQRCMDTYTQAFDRREEFRMEYRLRRHDREYRWVMDIGVPRFDQDRSFIGYIGIGIDVTEQKLAEEALSSVSRRLIEGQEQERFHIAQELHDDLSQRMALLQIGLGQFNQNTTGLSSQSLQQLHEIAEVATEVSSAIHDLSHQLHPSKLDTLGLAPSLRGLCKEFSEQHHLQVHFVHHDMPRQIPKNVTLCLFRVGQEALRNVVKHSGASEATVELSGHGARIDLCISDSGAGFDPESASGTTGLGLISMRERIRLIGGNLTVESEPSHGTRIRVHAPLLATDAEVTNERKVHKLGA